MGVLDGFYSTWTKARETFGRGAPDDGSEFDGSSRLMQMKAGVEAAAPDDRWQGSASQAYAAANREHASVYEKLAELDKKMAGEVKKAAEVVTAGRINLDTAKSWVDSIVDSLPATTAADRDRKLLPIANEGIGRVHRIVQSATDDMAGIKGNVDTLRGQYETVKNTMKFGPGTDNPAGKEDDERLGVQGDRAGEDDAKPNGQALADQAALPSAHRDPEVAERVAANLPQSPLTQEQIAALADGKEVTDVPKETLDYYRDFYQTAGKDGLLLLDRHLESAEAAGNAEAGAQRDRLANGLTVTSNENVVELNPDGSVASRGGYDQLPPDLREMLETRRGDPAYPGWETLGPTEAKNRHVADVVQFSELIGEAKPGYQPGSRLGTELYLKSADMVEYSLGGWGMTDTPPEAYERAASSLSEIAGRNNDSSYQIWSGNGDDLPDGYNREETVRTLIGHDWSQSGGGGSGAATLLDWITEDSQRPFGDPLGDRARQAFIEVPDMLAPSDMDPVWASQRDAFAHNPAIATEVGHMMAANIDSTYAPGRPFGFDETKLDPNGHPMMSADDSNRLFELAGYSDEGRLSLTTAAETARISELAAAMKDNPGNLAGDVANSAAGGLSGRIDNSITDALNRQNDVLGDETRNPTDALYRAKVAGAEIAGWASNELVGKIPGADEVTGLTGFDPGELVENKIKEWIGTPEYQETPIPPADNAVASSTPQAQQTILQAADEADQLPPVLREGDKPVDVSHIYQGDDRYEALQDFLKSRGLNQYVTDYGQSYAIMFDRNNGDRADAGGS